MEPPATGPTAGLSACSDTEKPLPEVLVAPFRQTPQQRERSRLSRLSQEGLVEVARGRGYRVASLTVADIRDTCDARFALETGIITLASERMTDERAQRLYRLSARTGDTSLSAIELVKRNQDFHVGIAEVTGSPRLAASARRIMEDSTRIFHLGLATFAEHGMQSEHDHLVDAIRLGDLPAAFQACRREAYGTIERVVTNLLQSPWAPSMGRGPLEEVGYGIRQKGAVTRS